MENEHHFAALREVTTFYTIGMKSVQNSSCYAMLAVECIIHQ